MQSCLLFVAKRFASIISNVESRLYGGVTEDCMYSPIFIIGSPRTGSTVLYQMLTHASDCLYIDNLVYAFFNNLPFGFWASDKIFGRESHDSFDSEFGNTDTWHSPSECGGFWYRWFPREKDVVSYGYLDEDSVIEVRRSINPVMSRYKKNMLFKNLNSGQRIRVLREIFPNAKFIFIKRDPLYTVQSLLQARDKKKIPDAKWWSVKPKNYKELNDLPIHEKLVGQVFHIEQQIAKDLRDIASDNVFIINYLDIKNKFEELSNFIGCQKKNEIKMSSFEFKNKCTLSSEHLMKIKKEINKYNWGAIGYEQ